MTLWIKARRTTTVILPALAVFVVVAVSGHNQYAELPSLVAVSGNRVFLMQLAPLLITSALGYSLTQRLPEIEATARRDMRLLDAALVTAVVAAGAVASVAVGVLADAEEATMAGRNLLFLTGLMLIARRIHEQAATVVPAAWVFVVMFVGHRSFQQPWIWAVTLHPAHVMPTLAFSLAVFAAGLGAHFTTR
ncbi:hypothetical protein [Streptomyces sp. MK5]|uniref:hypothetical protein n=1 Tax=Streptomyces sp. MK5 TaxID=3064253 RepID=UPI0027418532|nr:hypothetical protein [Streptomyces sp. MK5]